jgi:predicted outer membrane repeat protein
MQRSLRFALVALAMGIAWSPQAHARAFQVGCDEPALRQAVEEAGFNGEEDAISLAPGCLYALAGIVIAYPDDGFPITIQGNNATISGKDQRTAFLVNTGATLHLIDVTVTKGRAGPTASGDGGAIYNAGALTLTRSTVSDSEARTGGGIYNLPGASLTLVLSSVTGNTAGLDGGGIRNEEGRVTLIDSTVSHNVANGPNGMGAGVFNDDTPSTPARAILTLSNCTFSGNSSRFGAGVFNDEGRVTVSHCTFSDNTAAEGGNGGGIYHRNYFGGGSFRLGNSILANTLGGYGYDCVRDPFLPSNAIKTTGVTLVEDGSCEIFGAISGDPKLGALTGHPAHHPLQAGSPALEAAQNLACPGVDQRGTQRPKDGNGDGVAHCDLGSHERP